MGSVNACRELDWDWIGIEHGYCEDCLEFGLGMDWKIGIYRGQKVGFRRIYNCV